MDKKKPDLIDVHVGEKLKERRTMLRLSQENLAEHLGITFQQVQKYENGSNRIGASRLYRIAHYLGAEVSLFYEGLKLDELGNPVIVDLAKNYKQRSTYEIADLIDTITNARVINSLKIIVQNLVKDDKKNEQQTLFN